jgi:hypothetical protein
MKYKNLNPIWFFDKCKPVINTEDQESGRYYFIFQEMIFLLKIIFKTEQIYNELIDIFDKNHLSMNNIHELNFTASKFIIDLFLF